MSLYIYICQADYKCYVIFTRYQSSYQYRHVQLYNSCNSMYENAIITYEHNVYQYIQMAEQKVMYSLYSHTQLLHNKYEQHW